MPRARMVILRLPIRESDAVRGSRLGFYDSQPGLAGRYVADVANVMLVEQIVERLSINAGRLCGDRDIAVVPLKELGCVFNFKACPRALKVFIRPSRRR